jgi:hypothetical protein
MGNKPPVTDWSLNNKIDEPKARLRKSDSSVVDGWQIYRAGGEMEWMTLHYIVALQVRSSGCEGHEDSLGLLGEALGDDIRIHENPIVGWFVGWWWLVK